MHAALMEIYCCLQDSNLLNLPELGVFLLNGVQHSTEEESKRYDNVASEFHIF